MSFLTKNFHFTNKKINHRKLNIWNRHRSHFQVILVVTEAKIKHYLKTHFIVPTDAHNYKS